MQFITEAFPEAVKIAVRYYDFQMFLNGLRDAEMVKDEIMIALSYGLIDNEDTQMLLEVYGVDDPACPVARHQG